MSSIVAVHPDKHRRYSWVPIKNYLFTAGEACAPLLVMEFAQAASVAPIAFTRTGDAYSAVLLMSLDNKRNLLLTDRGRWRGSYIPAYYRSHPFCIALDKQRKPKLCFHSDSDAVMDRIVPGGKGVPFFFGDGLSPQLEEIRQFLQQIEAARNETTLFLDQCAELELFEPWPLTAEVGGKTLSLKGLFRISETKLKQLPTDAIKTLMDKEQLGPIYQHLASLHLAAKLVKISNFQEEVPSEGEDTPELLDQFHFEHMDDSIKLDW